jgi:hypothetical protein
VPRKPKDENHPLTRLRKILSEDGTEVTRELFAKRTGIPSGSIKALETGLYRLSPALAKKITFATGVNTNSILKRNNRDRLLDVFGRPYTCQSYREFQLLNESDPIRKMTDAHALCLRVLGLLRAINERRYNELFMRIYLELEEIWKEYKLVDAGKEFHATNLSLELIENSPSVHQLNKVYPFIEGPEGTALLNFSRFFEERMVVDPKIKKRRTKAKG